ncbi:FtsX-like permease family protein [Verrucosispora sioxanthis]|uniref:FtsX-like permease family protein n=1 Tax=Verrucosispora sioxanthis TaxID=2499994 RepID=UPI002E291952|nr:FtsX-like permease family protein [Verrucosispora sioxanthis]
MSLEEVSTGVLIGGLGLLEVVLLVGPAFAVGVRRRRRELALVAVAGGDAVQLRRVVLADGVVLGGVGAVTGIALGVAAAFAGRPLVEQFIFSQRFGGYRVWPAALVVIALVAVLAGVLAALAPAWTAARQDVVAGLAAGAPRPCTDVGGWPSARAARRRDRRGRDRRCGHLAAGHPRRAGAGRTGAGVRHPDARRTAGPARSVPPAGTPDRGTRREPQPCVGRAGHLRRDGRGRRQCRPRSLPGQRRRAQRAAEPGVAAGAHRAGHHRRRSRDGPPAHPRRDQRPGAAAARCRHDRSAGGGRLLAGLLRPHHHRDHASRAGLPLAAVRAAQRGRPAAGPRRPTLPARRRTARPVPAGRRGRRHHAAAADRGRTGRRRGRHRHVARGRRGDHRRPLLHDDRLDLRVEHGDETRPADTATVPGQRCTPGSVSTGCCSRPPPPTGSGWRPGRSAGRWTPGGHRTSSDRTTSPAHFARSVPPGSRWSGTGTTTTRARCCCCWRRSPRWSPSAPPASPPVWPPPRDGPTCPPSPRWVRGRVYAACSRSARPA